MILFKFLFINEKRGSVARSGAPVRSESAKVAAGPDWGWEVLVDVSAERY